MYLFSKTFLCIGSLLTCTCAFSKEQVKIIAATRNSFFVFIKTRFFKSALVFLLELHNMWSGYASRASRPLPWPVRQLRTYQPWAHSRPSSHLLFLRSSLAREQGPFLHN